MSRPNRSVKLKPDASDRGASTHISPVSTAEYYCHYPMDAKLKLILCSPGYPQHCFLYEDAISRVDPGSYRQSLVCSRLYFSKREWLGARVERGEWWEKEEEKRTMLFPFSSSHQFSSRASLASSHSRFGKKYSRTYLQRPPSDRIFWPL